MWSFCVDFQIKLREIHYVLTVLLKAMKFHSFVFAVILFDYLPALVGILFVFAIMYLLQVNPFEPQ